MMQELSKRVLIASDHAGVDLKAELRKRLPAWEWEDLGPQDISRVDYPDYAESLCSQVALNPKIRGILICGSGIGMSIAANKMKGIRAALVDNVSAAKLSREHNDANILCLGARFIAAEYAAEIVAEWLKTDFSRNERHAERLKKIEKLESKNSNIGK